MLAINRIIHAAHFILGYFSCELVERNAGLRMIVEGGPAHERHRFIRREIPAVILECNHAQSGDQAIG